MVLMLQGGYMSAGRRHLHSHWALYIVVIAIIAVGIASGAIASKILPPGQAEQLQTRVISAFQSARNGVDYSSLLSLAVTQNLKAIGLILFLGLTVLGLPFIAALLFFRGFVLGFAVGFLILTRPTDGIFVVLLTLVPSSLVFLPALIFAGVMALAFTLWLVKGRQRSPVSLSQALLLYAGAGAGVMVLATAAGLIDAYVTPGLLRIFYG
ncbi:stage II sporulation protein M [Heliobacterium chlorum]|uniref:Stage II sporulation protein M n=2 Tax=Heliobacterium chlorum TaxID=2698 RepID=A0ABR7T3E9_HELCL|nr:stage II sporulation protein M [Heliobacterium chlorum]